MNQGHPNKFNLKESGRAEEGVMGICRQDSSVSKGRTVASQKARAEAEAQRQGR